VSVVTARIQVRRGTAAEWTAANPVLAEGELAFETDTGITKIGDGATEYTDLPAYATYDQMVEALEDAQAARTGAEDARDAAVAAVKDRRHEWGPPYSYCGTAPGGSLETAEVWTVKRITVASDGSTTTATASNIAWTARATATYA
jgi:hypothetical protein